MKKRYVYVVTIEWVNEAFDKGTEQQTFSSIKKARDFMNAEYQKDLINYQERFDDNYDTDVSDDCIALCESGNYAENHIDYTLIKTEVQ